MEIKKKFYFCLITLNTESKINMKKYFLAALVALSLASCEEETSINTPAFEVMKGYDFWKADKMQATVKDGNLVIIGVNESENITLYVDHYELGQEYTLGVSNDYIATYSKKIDEVTYNYSSSSSTGSGYIKLDPVEKQVPGTISGTFLAEMFPNSANDMLPEQETVHLHKGIFFQIPLKDAVEPQPETPDPGSETETPENPTE